MIRILLVAGLAGLLCLPASVSSAAVEYVRVCNAYGAGWFYIPGTETCYNPTTGATKTEGPDGTIDGHVEIQDDKAEDALKGVALSLALPAATVDEGKSFGAAVNVGTFAGESAIGVSGAFRATDGLTVNGAVGFGLEGGPVGGRAGVNFSW